MPRNFNIAGFALVSAAYLAILVIGIVARVEPARQALLG